MEKYRAKSNVVEAGQWHEFKEDENGYYLGVTRYDDLSEDGLCRNCIDTSGHGWLRTLDGGYVVCPRDWIVRDVDGERFPLKPDVFERIYEAVIA